MYRQKSPERKNVFEAQAPLNALTAYLVQEHGLALRFRRLRLVLSPEQNRRNKLDPRTFCYCSRGDFCIFSAAMLDRLPLTACVGILLHEIGHLHLKAFGGPESEVDVDDWCLNSVPESGYYYGDCSYKNFSGDFRTAKNIEHVSPEFIHLLSREKP